MTLQEIIQKIEGIKKGVFTTITQITTKKPTKDFKDAIIEKHTQTVIRMGISYQNMKQNQNRITGKLPWGQWMAGYENYLIEHKEKVYLRLYRDSIHQEKTVWYLNGKETTEKYLIENNIMKPSTNNNACYAIQIENIVSIGA